ncbi:unnamed protein product [Lepidochelys kempii]
MPMSISSADLPQSPTVCDIQDSWCRSASRLVCSLLSKQTGKKKPLPVAFTFQIIHPARRRWQRGHESDRKPNTNHSKLFAESGHQRLPGGKLASGSQAGVRVSLGVTRGLPGGTSTQLDICLGLQQAT